MEQSVVVTEQKGQKAALRCQSVAIFLIGFLLPFGMLAANKSAPAIVVAAALLMAASIFLRGNWQEARQDLRALFSTELAFGAVALTVLAIASLAWAVDRAQTIRTLLEMTPVLLAGIALLIPLRHPMQSVDAFWLVVGLFLASVFVDVEAMTNMELHRLLGGRSDIAELKRSSDVIPALFWPAALWLHDRTKNGSRNARIIFYGFGLVCLLSMIYTGGGAARIAFLSGLAIFGIASFWPRVGLACVAVIGAFLLFVAPFAGRAGNALVSATIQTRLDQANMHTSERFLIWEAYGADVGFRPLLGHGLGVTRLIFGAAEGSNVQVTFGKKLAYTFHPRNPEVFEWAATGENHGRDVPHPHNAFLQIWVELGAVGALLCAILYAFTLRRIASLPEPFIPTALAMVATTLAMSSVGFGLWQAWWIATVFASVIWFGLVRRTMEKLATLQHRDR